MIQNILRRAWETVRPTRWGDPSRSRSRRKSSSLLLREGMSPAPGRSGLKVDMISEDIRYGDRRSGCVDDYCGRRRSIIIIVIIIIIIIVIIIIINIIILMTDLPRGVRQCVRSSDHDNPHNIRHSKVGPLSRR